MCLLRDLDGDGADDLAVGAPGYDEAGEDAGCVFLLVRKSVPSGTVSINDGAPYTNSPDVTLTITWSSPGAEVTQMRVRNAGEDWGDWGDPQETVSWTLTSGDGSKNVEVEFLDAGGGSAVVGSDPILLDTTPPSGTLTLQGGAAWTNTTEVTVGAAFTDAGSGVWQVSLRNQGGAWGSWFDPASPPSWTLTAGEGAKIVEAQCMDGAGNVSTPASDSIGLDQTAPSGTILIEGGAEFTNVRDVTVTLSASDSDGSGLASMRLKLATGIFDAWVPYATSALFTLPSGDGVKGIDAQFLDVAGNVSSLASDTILLDRTAPTLTSFTVNGGNQYVLPSEPVLLQIVASDGSPSSGVAGFRTTFDNGATYGPWTAYGTDPVATDHPATGGLIPIRVMLRDNAGNVSGLSTAQNVLFIEVGLPHLLSGGSFTGTMDDGNDIDALTLDLTKDDLVGMKLKKSPALAGAAFPLVFDLCRSNGERVLTGVASIAAFVAPATDRYYLVARQEGGAAGPGYYNFKLSVKMAKTAAKAKAVVTTGEFTFEAAAGSSLKLGLKGPGLDPASVTVVGPDGALAAPAAGKTGSAKLAAVLDKGTGVYTITFTATGPVKLSLSLKLPKGTAVVEP
ncbi:MAG: hypothetical protein MUE73_05815 [Planctomycetes bacterium]|nr:hypothetical protein [Planctomycetota bacterium]